MKLEPPTKNPRFVSGGSADYESALMEIYGTAIQAAEGKLVTCMHVMEAVGTQGFIKTRRRSNSSMYLHSWPIQAHVGYLDPRSDEGNPAVDLAVLLVAPVSTDAFPYHAPPVTWGCSHDVGVGDRVMVGGYPLGKNLFLANDQNRGVVQPTFYEGIISAILPATNNRETRIFQLSMPVSGGMSGGAVFDSISGEVLGMVTSGLDHSESGIPLPFTYALPSEVITPFVEVISFETKSKFYK